MWATSFEKDRVSILENMFVTPAAFCLRCKGIYISTALSIRMWSVLESSDNIFQTLQSLGTKTKERNTLKSLGTYRSRTVTKTVKSLGT